MTPTVGTVEASKMLPRLAIKRDRMVPVVVAASLLLHASVLLPLVLRDTHVPDVPREIPVELVQAPPPPPEPAAKAEPPARPQPEQASKPPEAKPPARAKPQAQRPAAKIEKPEPRQQAKSKPPATKPESTAQRMKDLLGEASTSIAGPSPTDPLPSLGAVALPGASADGTLEVSYARLVMSRVAKAKKQGRYAGVPGRARVSFTVSDAGEPQNIVLATPSGDASLDEEAVAMIKRGAPYPPPPPGARRDFTVGLQFRPESG